ncbi:Pyridoxine 5'-phosphate synthase [Halomonadaceae bacterium LMG 33818]|uniref:hypothetical protein n=1 Tax=Cernens ardua TaxID=3402176 RepID=UPI003EDBE403
MYDLRLQLGFNFDTLMTAIEAEQDSTTQSPDPEALSNCLAMALNALEGADYIAVSLTPSEFVQQVISLIATIARHRLLVRVPAADRELIAKAYALAPAQVCLVASGSEPMDSHLISGLSDSFSTENPAEILAMFPSSKATDLMALPERIEGVCLDTRSWASCRGAEREQKLAVLGSIIEHANDADRFVYLTELPSLKDAEEAAALPGVSAIEIGAAILPLALQKGLGAVLQTLMVTLVKAQEAGLQLALEDHEHHHHDHDADCGCHH